MLPDDIIESVVAGTHRPMNPHKQRLLAAEARAVVLPKESKTKPKKRAPSKGALKEKKAAEDPESLSFGLQHGKTSIHGQVT